MSNSQTSPFLRKPPPTSLAGLNGLRMTMGRSIFDKNPPAPVKTQQNILPSISKHRLITYAPLQREADRLKEEISLNSRLFGFSGSWKNYGSQRDVTGRRVSVRIAHRNDER